MLNLLPPVPDGATVYTHPQQGKTIYLLPDGTMQVWKADGRRTTTSASPAKLAAGYGAWELVTTGTLLPASAATVTQPFMPIQTLLPMLAQSSEITSLEAFILDDAWVFEQKLDGHRLLLVSPGGDFPPTALTRAGTPYTRGLPTAIKNFRFPFDIPAGEFVLDGELVGSTFYAFDMPRSGTPADYPLTLRRVILETFLNAVPNPFKLVPQAKTKAEKIGLAQTALANNFEGLVLKRATSAYGWGQRGTNWLKLKFVKTVDVIVLDVRDDGKESVRLGIIRNGVIIDVGRASLIGKEKRGKITKGAVIEVAYLYCNNPDAPRLYQPTILTIRDDKAAHECTDDQLEYTNKSVLQSL